MGLDASKIITHPNNKAFIAKYIKMESKPYIYNINQVKLIFNPYMQEKDDAKPYVRNQNVLPDNNLIEWVDMAKEPPSWAIFFGLVERPPLFFLC